MFKSNSIWFWQRILTPHIAALASELANRGFKVTFVANSLLSSARAKQGWETPSLGKAKLILARNKGFDTISDFVRDILLRNELDLSKLREIKHVLEVYSNGYDKRY